MKTININYACGRFLALILALLLVLLTQTSAAQTITATEEKTTPTAINTLKVATAVWPNYAEEKNNSGYFLELLKLAFPAPDYQLDITYVPYPRSKQLINNSQVDIAVGMIKGAPIYFSEYATYLGAVYHVALSKQLEHQWQGFDSLKDKRVGIPIGYSALKNLPSEITTSAFKDSRHMLKMLIAGRLDAFIDLPEDIQHMLQQLGVEFAIHPLPIYVPPLYIGFSRNEQGARLKRVFDTSFKQLVRDNQLLDLMKRSGVQRKHYHFHYPCLNPAPGAEVGAPCPPSGMNKP